MDVEWQEDALLERMEDYKEDDTGDWVEAKTRLAVAYKPDFARFMLETRKFKQQYSHVYMNRLRALRAVVAAVSGDRWAGARKEKRVLALREGQLAVVMGTIIKNCPLRPSVLAEFAEDRSLEPPPPKLSSYVSADDTVVLEDESGRVALRGSVDVSKLVTGIVAAAHGCVVDGELHVTAIIHPGLPYQMPRADDHPAGACVLLVSGLAVGGPHDQMAQQLLFDYVTGMLGGKGSAAASSHIVRVILAGDTLHRIDLPDEEASAEQLARAAEPARQLDMTLAELVGAVPVDIMPGEGDPAFLMLPQQPLHRCLLPLAARSSGCNMVTNPYSARIAGRLLRGGSGQQVADIQRYSSLSTLDALEGMLQWRHTAPTAPDSLPCYPFSDHDPFVLTDCPDILFAGNQQRFESRIVEGEDGQRVLCLSLPVFARTGTAVLVDLDTLAATPLSFALDDGAAGDGAAIDEADL
eukprot:PLAT13489.1.p1 GENE.PLAT13489.1~~PLAT13489.1.p1  ORF type:complete len:467 (-),score=174.74 PLAT13489.1:717-2117(-)